MKLRAILEGRWYTGRNAHQIWAEWAVWARWQILNGSQFFFHFNDKWLSVDNISWIYYQICLDKNFLLIHLRDCCGKRLSFFNEDTQNTVLHNSLCPSENKLSKSREESLSNWVVFQAIFSFTETLVTYSNASKF